VAAKPQRHEIAVTRSAVNSLLTKITNLPFFFNDFAKVRPMPRWYFATNLAAIEND
jgi:hypothetical protein